jgi:regulator of protease activity HflC (stomatin/prohibitin superfamily)
MAASTTTTTAEEKLTQLRQLVLNARSMPMSASCVINRGEVLDAIDDVIAHLPEEIAGAQQILDERQSAIAAGEAKADRLVEEAREQADALARDSQVVREAEEIAAKVKADAEAEAEALRRETDLFIDSRMAGFESVLHKTTSQVHTARARLAERSGLDATRTQPRA